MPNILLEAIKARNVDAVTEFLLPLSEAEREAVLNKEYPRAEGLPVEQEVPAIPLHIAVSLKSQELLQLLLVGGADPNREDEDYHMTPLSFLLTRYGYSAQPFVFNLMTTLVYYGATIDDDMLDGLRNACAELTATKDPALESNMELQRQFYIHALISEFQELLRSGNAQNLNEAKALFLTDHHFECNPYWNQLVVIVTLDPNYEGVYNSHPLLSAARYGDAELMDILINRCQGNPLLVDEPQARNLFHYATQGNNQETLEWCFNTLDPETVQTLLSQSDNDGNTPLHLAAIYGHFGVAKLLLENGANPSLLNTEGDTPAERANHPVIRQLLETAEQKVPSLLWLAAKKAAELPEPVYTENYSMDALIHAIRTHEIITPNEHENLLAEHSKRQTSEKILSEKRLSDDNLVQPEKPAKKARLGKENQVVTLRP